MVASQTPGTGRLVANHDNKFPSFPGWARKAGQECQVALRGVCIQQAVLGDKYGNGSLSTGTWSFWRGRSGCAGRFN